VLPDPVLEVLVDQSGVVARRQLLALGASPHDIERWRRRRDLTVVHPGVYVDHTGELSWVQRAWAAVLWCGPGAALCRESALRAHEGPGRSEAETLPIQVGVSPSRHPVAPDGVRVHRLRGIEDRVQWHRSPPRQRYDDATIDVAAATERPLDVVGVLAAAVQGRRTTARRLLDASRARRRVRGREWLEAVLDDIASGTTSVLEHGYLTRIERPRLLPSAQLQVRGAARTAVVYRDAEYSQGLLVELDGVLNHSSVRQRDSDLERDLDTALTSRETVRLGWGQVFERPCSTAGKIARLLELRGWAGPPTRCSPDCPVAAA
jgi:hypothetical protein